VILAAAVVEGRPHPFQNVKDVLVDDWALDKLVEHANDIVSPSP
jgi:hypothetical protein